MKLATTTGDFAEYVTTTDEAVKYIYDSGFKYIDYSVGLDLKNKTVIFSSDAKGYLGRLKKLTNNLGVKFIQSHAPMGAPLIYDENRDFLIDSTKKCIIACGELGIDNIVVHTGYRKGISKEENFTDNKAFFEELLETAEKYNVNILAENFNKMFVKDLYWIDNAEDLSEFVGYVSHPLLHACWDTGHGNMLSTPQDEALQILGKDVYALHIHDNMCYSASHIPPFFGKLNITSLMNGLDAIGYNGYFTFEVINFFAKTPCKSQYKEIPSLSLRIEAEKFLYQIGKSILTDYGLYEELF